METLVEAAKDSKYAKMLAELDDVLNYELSSSKLELIIGGTNIAVQRAFVRGMMARKHDGTGDSVAQAVNSGITDSHTLAVIYAKDQGYQE